jgi:indole-3-acetate monooxygenase
LLSASRALKPRIRASAADGERQMALPDEIHRAFTEAGVYRMLVPRDAGGDEVDLPTALRVIETLAVADGSAGWCAVIGAGTTMFGGFLTPDAARATLWRDPDRPTAGVFSPSGEARRVEGGYRVTGRWRMASGCRHASWMLGNCVVVDDQAPAAQDGPPSARMMAFPMDEATIHQTWDVVGLRGTGSHDVSTEDTFVPDERSFAMWTDRPRHESPIYAFPFLGFLYCALAAVATGIARGAIDAVIEAAADRAEQGLGSAAAPDRPTDTNDRSEALEAALNRIPHHVATEYGQVEAEARASRDGMFHVVERVWERVAAGDPPGASDRDDVVLASMHAARTAALLVPRVFRLGGAAVLHASHPLQRALRDVHVALQHMQFHGGVDAGLGRGLVRRALAARGD